MVIAVDFDGTIVENKFPQIGEPKLFAFQTLQLMQKNRHQLILWTTRTGNLLDEAVDFCFKNGVEFYAVNKSFPDETLKDMGSRKIICDVFISHKNFGGIPGWGEIWQQIQTLDGSNVYTENNKLTNPSFIQKLSNIFKKR